MAVFKPGQTVTCRGKSGVVEAVDRTPGMVDVRYGRLVKRHAASELAHGAKANPRRPRRSRRVKANPFAPKPVPRPPKITDKLGRSIRKHEEAISFREWEAVEAEWAAKSRIEKERLLSAFRETFREVEREQGVLRPSDIKLLHREEGVLATYTPLKEKWGKTGLPALFAEAENKERKLLAEAVSALQSARESKIKAVKAENVKIVSSNERIAAENEKLAADETATGKKKKMRRLRDVPRPLSTKQAEELAIARGFGPTPTFSTLVGMSRQKLLSGLAQARAELKEARSLSATSFVPSAPTRKKTEVEEQLDPVKQAEVDAAREKKRIRAQGERTLAKRSAKVTPTTGRRKQRVRVRSKESAPAYFANAKVGFEAHPDPPRFPVVGGEPQLNNLCGNPIDGTIYILAVKESGEGVRRDISRVTTAADVQATREERKKLNNGVDDWDDLDAATHLKLVKEWLKGKGFFETYSRYKVNEPTELGRVKEPYSAADVEYINEGGVFLTGKPRVRKARKSMTPKGRLQISGKSRSQGLFSKAQLPRETYFFPEPEGRGFVALVAIKRVVAADAQLKEFQPRFPYGSSKRRSPFFAWQKLYRPFDTTATSAQGQMVCETLAGKDAREAAATLKFKLLPLMSALKNLYKVAYTGKTRQEVNVTSGEVAKAIHRLLNALSVVGNDVLPVVELYIQSRKPGSIITAASITPQIAMVPAIVSFAKPDTNDGNPNMIPLSWFKEAFTKGPVPLFTPNRALQANLDALLVTTRGGTEQIGVEEVIKELQAGGSMPSPLKRNDFVCGGPGKRTKVDELDILLVKVAADNREDMNDPEVAAGVMADIIQSRYVKNFDAISFYSDAPYPPLDEEAVAGNLLASGVFNRLERPRTREADVDAAIAAMKKRSTGKTDRYWEEVKRLTLLQEGRQQGIDRQILEAATVARCRRGALYLYFSLGGPNLIKALEGAIKNLDAIIDYGGAVDGYEQFRRKGRVTTLLNAKPYAMTRKRADLGAQFYYTFNPALATLTQKMWHTGSPFTEGDETKLDSSAQKMNMNVQQVGVYGAMLKASYENAALAQRAFDDLAEEGIADAGDDDYRRNLLSELTLTSTDQALLVAKLGMQMKEKLPALYGRLGTVQQARALLGTNVDEQRRVLRVIEQVEKATRQGGHKDRRHDGLPYQDLTITDRGMRQLLAEYAVLYMAMGDGARRFISRGDQTGQFGSLSMSLSPEMSRQALSRARQRAEKAIHSASAFGSRAFERYEDRMESKRLSLDDDLYAAEEDLKAQGYGAEKIADILAQAKKAVASDPPFVGESLGPVGLDSPKHQARNRMTGVKRVEPSFFPGSSPLAALETGSSDAKEVDTLLKSLLKGSIGPADPTSNPRSRRPRRKKR